MSVSLALMLGIPQRLIGLTGGIGTGKTTVSRYLAATYGLTILDADIYAREAVRSNSPISTEILDRYGIAIQLPDGSLNRKQLGEIIFNHPAEKRWLESKIHPYVRDRFNAELRRLRVDTVVLAIPLLFEANLLDLVTEVWVVYCSEQEQIKRLSQRDRLSEQQAIARINSQLSLDEKVAAADVVLDNSSTLETLFPQIDAALAHIYKANSKKKF